MSFILDLFVSLFACAASAPTPHEPIIIILD